MPRTGNHDPAIVLVPREVRVGVQVGRVHRDGAAEDFLVRKLIVNDHKGLFDTHVHSCSGRQPKPEVADLLKTEIVATKVLNQCGGGGLPPRSLCSLLFWRLMASAAVLRSEWLVMGSPACRDPRECMSSGNSSSKERLRQASLGTIQASPPSRLQPS